MSTLHLATDPALLAARLADLLNRQARQGNVFVPARIVIPNRPLGTWLRFWLARRHGIAVNLRFSFLEEVLWDMLRAVDPRPHEAPPELLDGDTYRLLVLAVLLGEDDTALASLQQYFRPEEGRHVQGERRGIDEEGSSAVPFPPFSSEKSRRCWRRAWQLAGVLGNLIRDYEYHRQDALIQPWIRQILVLAETAAAGIEKSQWAVFDHIIRLKGGKRATLNEKTRRNLKTLPQYAMEVLETLQQKPTWAPGRNPDPAADSPASRSLTPGSAIHLFGLTQISRLHVNTLHWLGRFFELNLYHLNPLVSHLPESASAKTITGVADDFRLPGDAAAATRRQSPRRSPNDDLLHNWARAGAESFWLMGQLLLGSGFKVEVLKLDSPARKAARNQKKLALTVTVLHRLQGILLHQAAFADKLPQDRSLQIVGCPGRIREVETAYHSILHNLQQDPALQSSDVAVLVTDMEKYRPLIQAVFDRPPRRVSYSLLDYSAAGMSMFGKAVLGMLDLALESLTRTRVFEVLLNPCFLARLGVDRAQAITWGRWAHELGIFQGWDGQEKKDRGYPASSRYGWRLGLQRLRLGRFMEVPAGPSGRGFRAAPRFGEIVPFADLDSQDREQLDAFSRAVEGLLPTLVKLRVKQATGKAWADTLRHLFQTFLDVPADRPEEGQVRDRLLTALEQLPLWDHLGKKVLLPLSIIREFIHTHLEAIEGRQGEYLAGDVTIASLQRTRLIPFAVVYVLGLGEDIFPGSDTLSSFDLRGHKRLPGDVRPAEDARFLFLETLLAAKQKIYLLYNNRDVQQDRELLPAVPVVQLQRYLNQHVLTEDFVSARMPLHDHDPETLIQPLPITHDVGIHVNEMERLLALAQAREKRAVSLDIFQEEDFQERWRRRQPDFSLPVLATSQPRVPAITIKELAGFLMNPAEAALRRHLYLAKQEDDDASQNDEPFVGSFSFANRCTRQILQTFILEATQGSLAQALRDWPEHFRRLYEEEGLRCRAPEHAFGAADQAFLHHELDRRIGGPLAEFLRNRDSDDFCGPVLVGQSIAPVGARRRFPALTLNLPGTVPQRAHTQARLTGFAPLVWADLENFEILVLTNKADLQEDTLSAYLFEPVLLYVALRANPASFPGEISAQDWLKAREFHVYVSCKEDLYTYTYSLTAEEASAYLGHLAADFLDPTAFDLLPFEVIARDGNKPKSLSAAYFLPDDQLGCLPMDYRSRLEEKIEEASDSDFGNYWRSPLLDLARVLVPEDAFVKIRRRFRLLDRGPQGHREEKTK